GAGVHGVSAPFRWRRLRRSAAARRAGSARPGDGKRRPAATDGSGAGALRRDRAVAVLGEGAPADGGLRVALTLSILYRGPLSSCNYGCAYCPFAKHAETADELAVDRRALERFTRWVAGRTADTISVLFTPWGEALIRRWYQHALAELTNLPHVARAAIQTNLSCPLGWVEDCDKGKLAMWATFHPTEVVRPRFLAKCLELDRHEVRFSVGAVGLREHLDEIEALRRELPPHIYLWVNAYKRRADYYL